VTIRECVNAGFALYQVISHRLMIKKRTFALTKIEQVTGSQQLNIKKAYDN